MTEQNKKANEVSEAKREFRVAVKFDQVQIGHIPIYATDPDNAREQATKLLDRHKNPEIVEITEWPLATTKSSDEVTA